jgi:hypothetical protein
VTHALDADLMRLLNRLKLGQLLALRYESDGRFALEPRTGRQQRGAWSVDADGRLELVLQRLRGTAPCFRAQLRTTSRSGLTTRTGKSGVFGAARYGMDHFSTGAQRIGDA